MAPVVTVTEGKLLGSVKANFDGGKFYAFQGIPYAKPPLGELRFKAPQPPEKWDGVRDASREGSECYSRGPTMEYVGSEDCLFLNVYTRKIDSKELKPVMFYIHGGGFKHGSSKTDVYGPDFLLTEDIVLVTFNYRLGPLGFMYLEDPSLGVTGNAGLKDMVAALRWVSRNIASFCGEPQNVTIFGESAGAAAVHFLMLSPLTKGLFHRAIAQSGSALNMWVFGKKYSIGLVADVLRIYSDREDVVLRHLQELPVEQLVKSVEKVNDIFATGRVRPFGLVIEKPSHDAFLSEHPLDIIKSGRYHQVPLILGCTSREGMFVHSMVKNHYLLREDTIVPFNMYLRPGSEKYLSVVKEVKRFYFDGRDPLSNVDDIFKLYTDNYFLVEVYKSAMHHLHHNASPVYFYNFSLDTTLNFMKKLYSIDEPGACHADDIAYLFKGAFTPHLEPDGPEVKAIRRMVRMWTNFAKTGQPTPGAGLDPLLGARWEPIKPGRFHVMDIGEELRPLQDHPRRSALDFWTVLYEVTGLTNKM